MDISKIRVTAELLDKAKHSKQPINAVLRNEYSAELSALAAANSDFKDKSPVSVAMAAAGIFRNTSIQAFFSTKENKLLYPAFLETVLEKMRDGSAILNALLASTHAVSSRDVHTLIVGVADDEKKAFEMRRVAEGAELPEAELRVSEKTIGMYKYGLKYKTTYEALQDATVDQFADAIRRSMRYKPFAQIGAVIDTIVKGDGNSNPADSSAKTATAGVLTGDDITDFLIDFEDESIGLSVNTLIVNKPLYKVLAKMFRKTDESNSPRPGTMFKFPQQQFEDLTVIRDRRVPQIGGKDIVIALDNREAIDRYYVANSIINEYDRDIGDQTQIGTISERVGFGKGDKLASRILTLK